MVTDAMLKNAAQEAEDAFLAALPETDGEGHVFSDRFEKKIRKLMERIRYPARYYVKRAILIATALACLLLLLNPRLGKFKRISFGSEDALGPEDANVGKTTVVINHATDTVPARVPIYWIREKDFTLTELDKISQQITGNWQPTADSDLGWEMKGNRIIGRFQDNMFSSGVFTMTDEELEKRAWEVFNKIPILDGKYEYVGRTGKTWTSSSTETKVHNVRVTFRLVLDGLRVTGSDRCDMWFNDSGLIELSIYRYSYTKIGMIDLIPLEEAQERINDPDSFSVSDEWGLTGFTKQLDVEKVRVVMINQHSSGRVILQPAYLFSGSAILRWDDKPARFTSTVIAVPEKYTYD